MFRKLLGVGSLLLLAACAPSNQSQENFANSVEENLDLDGIKGGAEVTQDEALSKSVVAIYHRQYGVMCTGSLIGNNMVLTAAHCIEGGPSSYAIVFGVSVESSQVARAVKRIVVSPKYLNSQTRKRVRVNGQGVDIPADNYDIALMQFSGALPAGYKVATLLPQKSMLRVGGIVTLAGYGMQGDNSLVLGGLLKVDVKILDTQFGQTEILLDQSQGRGACQGDSGGPAYLRASGKIYLWGVTSRSPLANPTGCPTHAIYTNILSHLPWIHQTSQAMLKADSPGGTKPVAVMAATQ